MSKDTSSRRERRRLGPQRGGSKKSEVPESWELIGATEALKLKDASKEAPSVATVYREENDAKYELSGDEEGMEAGLLLPLDVARPIVEKGEALNGSAVIEALIEASHGRCRHIMLREGEAWQCNDQQMVIVPFADEIDGVASRDLRSAARSGSDFHIVSQIKQLASDCARPPTWKASMASELDSLASRCFERNQKLQRLQVAKHAFEERIDTAKQYILKAKNEPFGSPKDIKARAETLVINQLNAQCAHVDQLLEHFSDIPDNFFADERSHSDDAPPKRSSTDDDAGYQADAEATKPVLSLSRKEMPEPPSTRSTRPPSRALLDAILAMILLRTAPLKHEFPHNFQARRRDLHEELVQSWRDEVGVLPGPLDCGGDPFPSAAASLIAHSRNLGSEDSDDADEN